MSEYTKGFMQGAEAAAAGFLDTTAADEAGGYGRGYSAGWLAVWESLQ